MSQDEQKIIDALTHENDQLKASLKALQRKLVTINASLLSIVDNSSDGVIIVDDHNMVVYSNYTAISLLNKSLADLLGEPVEFILEPNYVKSQGRYLSEILIENADGTTSTYKISVVNTEWNNVPSQVINLRDITQQKKKEATLRYMVEHDLMTDLPNRVVFEAQMYQAIQDAKEHQEHMAVLYLDLDDFKPVNDTLGHQAGDSLLKSVASVLNKRIRQDDTLARLGGDEFALILTKLRKPEYAGMVALNLLETIDRPFTIGAHEVRINMSIGIAVYPLAGESSIELMEHADQAMYASKKYGKNQYRFYSDYLNKEEKRLEHVVTGFRNALEKDEFFIVYQPIIDVATEACVGVEALLRWEHPLLGTVYPDEFLPEAEKLNLMASIGRWVVQHVFSDVNLLMSKALSFVSLNITANELSDKKTLHHIVDVGKTLQVNLNSVIFELTETTAVENFDLLIEKLEELSKMPIRLAIDDYGIGYSSLSYLKRLPISILKIDKLFVQSMSDDPNSSIILKSTIKLAHNLSVPVIAEGAETKEQVAFLRENKCDYVQGFYFSKPLLLEEVCIFIEKSHQKQR